MTAYQKFENEIPESEPNISGFDHNKFFLMPTDPKFFLTFDRELFVLQ
jgi:hypothetical protein